jgi:AbiV family abortive infection protein
MSFRIDLDQLVSLMDATIENARNLHSSARLLLANNQFAPSVALCVLALEEIGKAMICDALAMAPQGSDRAVLFDKKRSNHATKLSYLDLWPLFLKVFHAIDDRQNEPKFGELLVVLVDRWRASRRKIEGYAPPGKDFDFNVIKQAGVYVGLGPSNQIERPAAIISQSLAADLDDYTFNTVEPISHFWKRNRVRYQQMFQKLRQLEPDRQAEFTKVATQVVEQFFRDLPDDTSAH